jgi:hypothetical protein
VLLELLPVVVAVAAAVDSLVLVSLIKEPPEQLELPTVVLGKAKAAAMELVAVAAVAAN